MSAAPGEKRWNSEQLSLFRFRRSAAEEEESSLLSSFSFSFTLCLRVLSPSRFLPFLVAPDLLQSRFSTAKRDGGGLPVAVGTGNRVSAVGFHGVGAQWLFYRGGPTNGRWWLRLGGGSGWLRSQKAAGRWENDLEPISGSTMHHLTLSLIRI